MVCPMQGSCFNATTSRIAEMHFECYKNIWAAFSMSWLRREISQSPRDAGTHISLNFLSSRAMM